MAKTQFPSHKKLDPDFEKIFCTKNTLLEKGKTGLVGELMDSPAESNEKTR